MISKPNGHVKRPKLILASSSPRRMELLDRIGWPYEVHASDVDERVTGTPRQMVDELCERKARAAAAGFREGILLAADTLVALSGQALGKPLDAADARRMLALLSGRTHEVLTGVCMMDVRSGRLVKAVDSTEVRFRPLSDAEIDGYIASGEPMGKAGAYAVQGRAGAFVAEMVGSFENVMGLPVQMLDALLLELTGGQE